MSVERYSHVMHLVSNVAGASPTGTRPVDVLRAAFPAGTLSGAPKIRAMQIIDELETARRGIYGGAVGYISYAGNLDLAIAIRTLVTLGDRSTCRRAPASSPTPSPTRAPGVRQQGARRAERRRDGRAEAK